MEFSFVGKNIVVTGAGQGIGRVVSEQLCQLGAQVYAFSRSPEPLAELVEKCPTIKSVTVNLSNWDATREAFKCLQGIPIHGLVNNAGVSAGKPFADITEENIDYIFSTNFKALFNVTQIVVPQMVSGSSIVNVSSLAACIGIQDLSVYSASKAAVDSLTRSLTVELATRNIRVNSVNPTVVLTKMSRARWTDPANGGPILAATPMGRFAELNEVCEPIVYLLSDLSSFINGHQLPIDGGYLAC